MKMKYFVQFKGLRVTGFVKQIILHFLLVGLLVTGIYRELCLESVKNKYECEIQAACQHWEVRGQMLNLCQDLIDILHFKTHFLVVASNMKGISVDFWLNLTSDTDFKDVLSSGSQSEKLLLFDTVQSELEEKIRRLEEDRHSIDITSGSSRPQPPTPTHHYHQK